MTNDQSLLNELLYNSRENLELLGRWREKTLEHLYALGGWITLPSTPHGLEVVLKSQVAIGGISDLLHYTIQPQALRWIGPCRTFADLVERAMAVGSIAGWAERGWRSSIGTMIVALTVEYSVITALIRCARNKTDDATTEARRYLHWFFRLDGSP